MVIDIDMTSTPSTSLPSNSEESSKKGKAKEPKEIKKVRHPTTYPLVYSCYDDPPPIFLDDPVFPIESQEARAEVRLLEYSDIPGITKNRRLAHFQRVAASAKKAKTNHLNSGRSTYRSSTVFYFQPYSSLFTNYS